MADTNRLHYLDNLKVFLIFLVIVHHVGQAYGATGGAWYYAYPGQRVQALSNFFGFNASFFMGLFFFISGYFFPASFDRHGARKFILDKLIRFGARRFRVAGDHPAGTRDPRPGSRGHHPHLSARR